MAKTPVSNLGMSCFTYLPVADDIQFINVICVCICKNLSAQVH